MDRAAINKVVFDGLGAARLPARSLVVAGLHQAARQHLRLQPHEGQGHAQAAGYPKGVKFTLIIPSGDTTFARAAALIQRSWPRPGSRPTSSRSPARDILTDVYIKKQGDAAAERGAHQRPRHHEQLRGPLRTLRLPGQRLGSVNQQLTPLIEQANASLSPEPAGPADAAGRRDGDPAGTDRPIEFMPSIVAYNKSRVGGNVVAPIGQCRSNLAGIYIKK